ncbi:hypothetical protein ASA1KI_05450 [Opitutales bacterium ASA1]|nr:hypothetical protein ASA1KI_05450 [Opitutales bacterium ASA1]
MNKVFTSFVSSDAQTPPAMKTRFTTACLFGSLLFCAGAVTAVAQTESWSSDVAAREVALRSDSELDELLGPLALYPDSLVALVLPASTFPADLVLAARFLEEDRTTEEIDAQPWEDSVKALAHFPDVVRWLDVSLAWTKQVGDAFLAQPEAVMDAVQRLRARAYAAGTLKTTAEQSVTREGQVIRIAPADPRVIYVPQYETEVVYVDRPVVVYRDPPVRFVVSYHTGWWLTHDCDWRARRIWHSDWRWNYRHRPERNWYNPSFPGYVTYVSHPHRNPWISRTPVRRSSWSEHPDFRRRTSLARPDPFTPRPRGTIIVDRRDPRHDREDRDRARDGDRRDPRRPNPGVVTPPSPAPEVVAPPPPVVRQPAHPWRPRTDHRQAGNRERTVVTTQTPPPATLPQRQIQTQQPAPQHPWRRQNVDTSRRESPSVAPAPTQRRVVAPPSPAFTTSAPSAPPPAVVTPPPAAIPPPPPAVAPPARQRDGTTGTHPWRRGQKNEN